MGLPSEATIVEFRPEDYSEAFELWKKTPGMGLSAADEREPIVLFLKKNPGLCFVAKISGVIVGTILCGSDGRRGYLYHLAVDTTRRRRGLGGELARRCLVELRARGIDKCHLFLIANNELGRSFWEAAGWTRRDDIVAYSKET